MNISQPCMSWQVHARWKAMKRRPRWAESRRVRQVGFAVSRQGELPQQPHPTRFLHRHRRPRLLRFWRGSRRSWAWESSRTSICQKSSWPRGGRRVANPGFLVPSDGLACGCRQTGRTVNVKKGQFTAPGSMKHAVDKIRESDNDNVWLTERGTMHGYGDLVVDMRGLTECAPLPQPSWI